MAFNINFINSHVILYIFSTLWYITLLKIVSRILLWQQSFSASLSFISLQVWVTFILFSLCFPFHTFAPAVSLFPPYMITEPLSSPSTQLFPSLSSLSLSPSVSFSLFPTEKGLFLPRMPLFCSNAHFPNPDCCFRLHSLLPYTHTYTHRHTHTHIDTRFTSMQNGGSLCSWRLTRRRVRWQAEGRLRRREGEGRSPLGRGEVSDATHAHDCVHTYSNPALPLVMWIPAESDVTGYKWGQIQVKKRNQEKRLKVKYTTERSRWWQRFIKTAHCWVALWSWCSCLHVVEFRSLKHFVWGLGKWF